ncbi:hypothetical protein [Actinoplanes sp. DH11]|uniref:hypothetical protein n=1 Tax=Actinoplanes sp. DH11 TaxID=2857011 RepID=UPI001E57ECFA|nr:hypothetical protein [Actinoplanes sp. DH11]
MNDDSWQDLDPVVAMGAGGAVPETVTVAGATVRIEAYLWRDFMPICPPDGQPLIASVRILAEPAALPATLRADRIVVVHGGEVWVAPLVEEYPGSREAAGFQVVARNGPKWDPNVTVDVVVELRDEQRYVVGASGVLIHETS